MKSTLFNHFKAIYYTFHQQVWIENMLNTKWSIIAYVTWFKTCYFQMHVSINLRSSYKTLNMCCFRNCSFMLNRDRMFIKLIKQLRTMTKNRNLFTVSGFVICFIINNNTNHILYTPSTYVHHPEYDSAVCLPTRSNRFYRSNNSYQWFGIHRNI